MNLALKSSVLPAATNLLLATMTWKCLVPFCLPCKIIPILSLSLCSPYCTLEASGGLTLRASCRPSSRCPRPPLYFFVRQACLSPHLPVAILGPGSPRRCGPWPGKNLARTCRARAARASELVRDSEAPGSAWMLVAPWRRGHRANSSDLAEGTAGAAASTHPLLRRRPVRGLPLTPGPVPAEVQDSP